MHHKKSPFAGACAAVALRDDSAAVYALQAAGLVIDAITYSGRIERVPTKGRPKSDKAGWYMAFADGGIVFGNWRTLEVATWQPAGCPPPDRAAIERAKQERDMARQREWDKQARTLESIWNAAAKPTTGGIIARYLAQRGLQLPDGDALRGSVREYWHEGQRQGEFACMLAAVTAPDGRLLSIHRTYLQGDRKADVPQPKKLMQAAGWLRGAAVRLSRHGARIGIAEGIETALSASRLFGVPTWAAVSAGGLASWQPPEGVTAVDVFADNDDNGVGQEAAAKLAQRLANRGLEVRIHTPEQVGDWNDELLREAN